MPHRGTQTEALLLRLQRGPLTPLEALTELGIYRLAARIKDLRDEGYDIHTRMVEVKQIMGTQRFAEYRLEQPERPN